MTLIDNAIYVGGRRVATPRSLDETYTLQETHEGFAWIGMYRPTAAELASVAAEFGPNAKVRVPRPGRGVAFERSGPVGPSSREPKQGRRLREAIQVLP